MLYINIDLGGILDLQKIDEQVKDALRKAAAGVAAQIHGHLVKAAGEKLHSRREMYVDSLKLTPVNDDVWVVSLDSEARWIEDGMQAHNMLEDLLASPKAKKAKDGSRYVIVPFDHGPGLGKTNSTQAEQDLVSTLKSEFKKRGIPFGKLELDAAGQPKLGKIQAFDVMNSPVKTHNGPGQGKGPIGAVRQGPTGIPFLQGVRVYQSVVKDKQGKNYVKKSIMTFRVASSKHMGQDRWNHPGLEPINLFEDAVEWAQSVWEQEIAPNVVGAVMLAIDKG